MKIKYFLLSYVVTMFMLCSCEDALNTVPEGKISYDEIFANNDKVGAFLNTCYATIPAKGVRYYFWSRGPVEWCDEAWDADAEAESSLMSGRMYNGSASASLHPITDINSDQGNGNYWSRYWQAIRNCSYFLSRIDAATVTNESDRNLWRAEAHLLRAFYYSELLKWFGASVPIEDLPYTLTADYSTLKKESFYTVVQFIIKDCDAALATSELPWRITQNSEAGRVNKAMAEAIKSKMILFAASPLYNGGNNYWEEAYTINKTSLANLRTQGYALYNAVNYPAVYQSTMSFFGPNNDIRAALYNEYFTKSMAYSSDPVDKETLYQSTASQGNIRNLDGIGAQDGYKSGTCPSQELVDAYETSDGKPILDLENPYLDDNHLQPNYNKENTLYNPSNPYANRDPRFYASIYYNGSKRKCYWSFSETTASPENYPAAKGNRTRIIATYDGEPQTGISYSIRKASRTGYYERKFLHPNSGSDNVVAGAGWKFFRLGEVILDFAEAAAEAGHLTEAEAAVNEIRARVGMPNIPAGLSQAQMILRVRHERQVELAMEENRYFDVRRWTKPDGDLAKTDRWITGMKITRNSNGTYLYNRINVRATERKCYTNPYLFVPIPASEASILLSVTGKNWQNPGW